MGCLRKSFRTWELFSETLAIRDLRTCAEELGGRLYHYHDKSDLECDAVMRLGNGKYGLIEVKTGGETLVACRKDDGVLVCPIGCLRGSARSGRRNP